MTWAVDGGYDTKAIATAYGGVRRCIVEGGYQRGKRKGKLVASANQVLKRYKYLRLFFENRSQTNHKRRSEVYLDESYIHEYHHWNKDSIWDPIDEQDVIYKDMPAKGRRYFLVAAIMG